MHLCTLLSGLKCTIVNKVYSWALFYLLFSFSTKLTKIHLTCKSEVLMCIGCLVPNDYFRLLPPHVLILKVGIAIHLWDL